MRYCCQTWWKARLKLQKNRSRVQQEERFGQDFCWTVGMSGSCNEKAVKRQLKSWVMRVYYLHCSMFGRGRPNHDKWHLALSKAIFKLTFSFPMVGYGLVPWELRIFRAWRWKSFPGYIPYQMVAEWKLKLLHQDKGSAIVVTYSRYIYTCIYNII